MRSTVAPAEGLIVVTEKLDFLPVDQLELIGRMALASVMSNDELNWMFGPDPVPVPYPEEIRTLVATAKLYKEALDDIWSASRDDGLAAMCNWMRGRAAHALQGKPRLSDEGTIL